MSLWWETEPEENGPVGKEKGESWVGFLLCWARVLETTYRIVRTTTFLSHIWFGFGGSQTNGSILASPLGICTSPDVREKNELRP